jgi:hypothetical protein
MSATTAIRTTMCSNCKFFLEIQTEPITTYNEQVKVTSVVAIHNYCTSSVKRSVILFSMQKAFQERHGRYEVIWGDRETSDVGIKMAPSGLYFHDCAKGFMAKCIEEMMVANTVLHKPVYAVVEHDGRLCDMSCQSADSVEVTDRNVKFS